MRKGRRSCAKWNDNGVDSLHRMLANSIIKIILRYFFKNEFNCVNSQCNMRIHSIINENMRKNASDTMCVFCDSITLNQAQILRKKRIAQLVFFNKIDRLRKSATKNGI